MSLQEFGYKEQLSRVLKTKDLIIYGMIFMVPIAPFGVFGFVYQSLFLSPTQRRLAAPCRLSADGIGDHRLRTLRDGPRREDSRRLLDCHWRCVLSRCGFALEKAACTRNLT
jgi:hypothetical protein